MQRSNGKKIRRRPQKQASDEEEDRISSLPDNVREHILKFLPLKESAKASLLSTRWRNLWMTLPTLVLDENFGGSDSSNLENKLMLDICRVLMLHRGPLKEFSLSLSVQRIVPAYLDQILLFLRNKLVETLNLNIQDYEFKLPGRLFSSSSLSSSFSNLKALRLSFCQLTRCPNMFGGLNLLTVLELEWVRFCSPSSSSSASARMGSICLRSQSLLSLTLHYCCNIPVVSPPYIVIEAPKLSCLHFTGESLSIELKHTPALKNASVCEVRGGGIGIGIGIVPANRDKSRLARIWGGLASVESLSVTDDLYQHAVDLTPLKMLAHLSIPYLRLKKPSDAKSIMHTIASSPNLQRLTITMGAEAATASRGGSYSSAIDDAAAKYELSRVTRVEVMRLTKHEVPLVKWLLNSSPALETMEIELFHKLSAAGRISILKELNGFQRPSTRACIIVN